MTGARVASAVELGYLRQFVAARAARKQAEEHEARARKRIVTLFGTDADRLIDGHGNVIARLNDIPTRRLDTGKLRASLPDVADEFTVTVDVQRIDVTEAVLADAIAALDDAPVP